MGTTENGLRLTSPGRQLLPVTERAREGPRLDHLCRWTLSLCPHHSGGRVQGPPNPKGLLSSLVQLRNRRVDRRYS
jgi:hypothetical protein